MECPHLSENVKLESAPVLEESDVRKEWLCTVCSSNQNSWVCVHCGYIGCGRYVNGHAKEHAEENDGHNICMDCESLSVFCYTCDEFVINDTKSGHLEHLRKCFINNPTKTSTDGQSEDSETTTDTNEEENGRALVNGVSEQNHRNEQHGPIIRVRRKLEDGIQQSSTNKFRRRVEEDTRKLRPRIKRSYSTDSNSVEDGSIEKKERNGMTTRTLAKNQRDKKVVGLRNLGNTCFMNAVLQSLSNIGIFYRYFKHLPALELNGKSARGLEQNHLKEVSDALMAEELRKVLINLNQGGKSAISPESLFSVIWKIVPRFRGYQQQDAHEFLRYMLDRLHLELLYLLPDTSFRENSYLNIGPRGRSSIVTSVFGGTLQSEVRCLNCSVESKKHDPFLDLSLDIPEKFQFLKKNKECGDEPTATCDISDCLTSFIEVEELAETELYHCNNCKSKQRSTKRFWIRRLPNVLCLHLKRFRWNNCFRQKIDTSIMFPVTALNMSQYVLSSPHETRRSGSGSTLYDLAAVIVHHGSGTGSGHYTAFAINDDGEWWHFNDSSVRQTEIETVAKCKPYIMFYIRREFQLPPLHA